MNESNRMAVLALALIAPLAVVVGGRLAAQAGALSLDAAIARAAARIEARVAARIGEGTEVAVINVKSPSAAFSELVINRLEDALVEGGKVTVVDRSNMDKILAEQRLQLSGSVSDESARSIGKMLGAGAIVTGTLTDLGDVYDLTLKAIDIEQARVLVSMPADVAKDARTLAALGLGGTGTGGGTGTPARSTVSSRVMKPSTIQQTVKLSGNVSTRAEVGVYPETAGKVLSFSKSVGDTVRAGEIIGYIDPSKAGTSYQRNPVVCPVAGTLISLPVAVGEKVRARTKIATIGSLGSLKLTIYVAEKYSAYLRRGLPAVVSFAAAPGETFRATVDAVSPVVNATNRTIETDLSLAESDSRIKPGMSAEVELVIQERAGVFVLPKSAVKTYNAEQVVYVIDRNEVARRISVTTGLSNDADIEIISGLSEGDRVVTGGFVDDGSPVLDDAAGQMTARMDSAKDDPPGD